MFILNGKAIDIPQNLETETLLDVLRDHLHLKGTKYGCGQGLCGACTVHVDGAAQRACQLTPAEVDGHSITTIEGLASLSNTGDLHPVQQAWIVESVPQCGYCQPGQIMTAAALLAENPRPSDLEIRSAMSGNLCRCGTYDRIRRAVSRAAQSGPKPAQSAETK